MARVHTRIGFALSICLTLLSARSGAQDNSERYQFSGAHGQVSQVELQPKSAGFEVQIPASKSTWDTALLQLEVKAQGKAPSVLLSVGDMRVEQHIDPEANGLRTLNLTGLRSHLTSGGTVTLRANDLSVRKTTATLRLFATPELQRGPILILAPHPDDAEIAAFGLYATHHQRVTIATMTSGNSGDPNYAAQFAGDVPAQYQFKGYIRAVDSVTVPWQGEVPPERCLNLGYFDARLIEMQREPSKVFSEAHGPNQDVSIYRRANLSKLLPAASRTATWQHLVEDIAALLRKVRPAVVVLPHPWLDTHNDHQYVTVAAAEALKKLPSKPTFLLYTNHACTDRYPFGPAGTVMSIPPWYGAPVNVQRVHSFPTDVELQRRKLFALESMHDLRLSPAEQGSCGAPAAAKYARVDGSGYYRRAVRAEETFFVLDRAGLNELVQAFLASPPVAPPPPASALPIK